MGSGKTFESVVRARFGRRVLLKAGAVIAGSAGTLGAARLAFSTQRANANGGDHALGFDPIAPDRSDGIRVADGYAWKPVIRWGDPILEGGAEFDLADQSREKQEKQFGFNCDYVQLFPLENEASRGLLWVNHEYTDGFLMFADYEGDVTAAKATATSKDKVDIELAAHGASVVEVDRADDGSWYYLPGTRCNRRITGFTPIAITGPAAGSKWLKTSDDASGTSVLGMLNNCGGGSTPWGTVLTCEENFNQYFAYADDPSVDESVRGYHKALGLPAAESARLWETVYSRFDVRKEPHEPFRFGWIVEVDPRDPDSVPKKRTALGRFKHEAAATTLANAGNAVVYTGDDERFQYLYKFVTTGAYNPDDRASNSELLDDGTLYVARFESDGSGQWLPLVWGHGPLTADGGFADQAEVLIRAREAGSLLGATKMDRPEDVQRNPVTGKVYMVCTNNTNRGVETNPGPDESNPRPANRWGHVIEISEHDNDAGAGEFEWEIFLLCGDPSNPEHGTYFAGFDPADVSPIGSPDNIDFDSSGNLWIATDGQPSAFKEGETSGPNDGLFAVPVEGERRGQVKQLFSSVLGAEVASLFMSDGDQALFASIQHPGEGSTLAEPSSSFPNASEDGAPRPTVIAIYRKDGGAVGA